MIKDIKYNGYTATPSDYECPDGDLAGAYNLVPEDGALHPILPPEELFTLDPGESILWIHKIPGHTHYIILNDGKLYWVCEQDGVIDPQRHEIVGGTITGTPMVGSIGNTLIVNDDSGLNYFLWTTEGTQPRYEALGQKPPMLNITFGLHSDFAVCPAKKNTGDNDTEYGGTFIHVGNVTDGLLPKLGESGQNQWAKPLDQYLDTDYNFFKTNGSTYTLDGVIGTTDQEKEELTKIKNMLSSGVMASLNKFVNEMGTTENKFVLPFFVRYAYRMYDESYVMHSYPVLMIPNSRGPFFALDGYQGLQLADNSDNRTGFSVRGRIYGFLSQLVYSIKGMPDDLAKWKDLILSVDIGVSAPIFTYDQAGEVLGWTNMDDNSAWDEYYGIGKLVKMAGADRPAATWGNGGILKSKDTFQTLEQETFHIDSTYGNYGDYFNSFDKASGTAHGYRTPSYIATIPQKSKTEINKSVVEAANYYVVKRLTIDELEIGYEKDLDMEDGTLSGLLGRKTMGDDYHSHDRLKASMIYTFNGRVNYSGIERTPHNPLTPEIEFPQASALGAGWPWTIAVTIKNQLQELTVQSEQAQNALEFPRWIYYPDANAKFAYVTKSGVTYKLKLTPHDLLNGAYWLADNWMKQSIISGIDTGNVPVVTGGAFVEQNKVYTSVVNDPFVIEASGINTVGTGTILGICTAAKPLSEGQFGQFPLYCFTTEGVWALETSSTGSYIARQPITRDVCNNPDSITQLDDAVLFTSDRGIMLLSGSTCQCISDDINTDSPASLSDLPGLQQLLTSEQLSVPALLPFSQFLDGCRMIYDYTHQRIIVYNSGSNYAYVYSLKDHKWSTMPTSIDYGVNSYPEALAVTDDGMLVDLSKDGNVTTGVKGIIITRPIKLESDILKTWDTVIQRGYFNHLDTSRAVKPIRTILYGSRDLFHWHLVYSSTDHYLRGFRGTPYKFFRIVLLVDFRPDESVYGCTIQYNLRYTNRPR